MRDAQNREQLWEDLHAGRLDTLGSDHSPAPWTLKENPDFSRVWGGISGIQQSLPLLLDAGLSPEQISRLTAGNPAARFRLAGKGRLLAGMDADLVLVEMGGPYELQAENLYYRHRHSPYVGRSLRARVVRTILRGNTVFNGGPVASPPTGRLLKPQR
jgi:allantoinase